MLKYFNCIEFIFLNIDIYIYFKTLYKQTFCKYLLMDLGNSITNLDFTQTYIII